MLKVLVPYTMGANAQLVTCGLQWPDQCACCGCPHPPARATLFHTARARTDTTDYGTVRYTTRSGYSLSWQIPYCDACLSHQKKAKNPLGPGVLLVIGFLIMLGVGYALFDAGYSENNLVIGGYVVFIGLIALIGYGLYRGVGAARLRQATQAMTPDCSNPSAAVTVISNMEQIIFTFSNDGYAREFATTNGL